MTYPCNTWRVVALNSVFIMLLSACGGGGGSSGGLTGGISYTGNTSAAAVTLANGEDLVVGAYQGTQAGFNIGGAASSLQGLPTGPRSPRSLALYHALRAALEHSDVSTAAVPYHAVARTDSEDGECGGTASFSISYDEAGGAFSGTFTFTGFCNEGAILNGTTSFVGTLNTITEDIIDATISFNALTMTSGAESFSLGGEVIIAAGNSSDSVFMDLRIRDNSTSKVAWIDNLNLTVVQDFTYEEISMTGRFYDPDLGFVTISTPVPLRILDSDEHASSGVLVAAGANGSATLTALSNTTYQIDIDTNGDASSDQTTTSPW